MGIICTRCGGTNISCKAIVDPNTKEFKKFVNSLFYCGHCYDCKKSSILTDIDNLKKKIQLMYDFYVKTVKKYPKIAACKIAWKDDNQMIDVRFALTSACQNDDETFFYCNSLNDLKSFVDIGMEDFVIIDIYYFE